MSEQTEGRTASVENSLAEGDLRVVVWVNPDCIEQGYNAVGEVVLPIDVAALPAGARAALRLTVEAAEPHKSFRNAIVATDPRGGRFAGIIRLERPTLEAFLGKLHDLAEWDHARKTLRTCAGAVEDIVLEAVDRTLPTYEKRVYAYWDGPGDEQMFSLEAVGRIRDNLGPSFEGSLACLRMAALMESIREFEGREYLAVLGWTQWPRDWLHAHLQVTPAIHLVGRLEGDVAREHAITIEFLREYRKKQRLEDEHARSPAGLIEAVLAETGTESQAERWKEGVLPDEEVDALLVRHVFAPVIEVAAPETRLDREDVLREVRKARPGASIAKLTFATEEARGLTEAEWAAFKAVRATLPAGIEANVVRTVASVQTAADGSYVLRRPLVSLKGSFAEREVRLRVDLGTGFELRAA